jgi:hypothetical protein
MLQSGLDQLFLEIGSFGALGLQITLVLEEQLFLFGRNPEWMELAK